jgi:hypothetical protein
MIRLIENVGDRLLGLVVPQANAQATQCSCDFKGYVYQSCGCPAGSAYLYQKKAYCNGCTQGAFGTCYKTGTLC